MIDEIIKMPLCFKNWLDVEMRLQDKGEHNINFDDDDDTNIADDVWQSVRFLIINFLYL